ncbi:glucosamine-6-phosphate deaminase [uncultured Tessaracoccus sp.]|uniref:glucosamine-6-phosphate deaminase n=1 Tax=uncultured Tessaracoccus sp. TaxID=905023 RepID=UPI002639D6A4|nr:glucosamine-6-phosphate deaminase [uncultured Tessaracoccus sp.]
MQVVICPDAHQVGNVSARFVAESLRASKNPVIGLATGSSPLGLYAELARMVHEEGLDFSAVQGFALDEYVGISYDHPESYHAVIQRTVVEPLGMRPENVHVPEGIADDVDASAAQYDADIEAAGGIDVQVLGIGANGHIGFNEPFTSFAAMTHTVPLTQQTRADNARFFGSIDEVPTHAVTQGIATIMRSRRAVLVAQGEGKADAIAAMVEGPISQVCPSSMLQFHPDAIVVVDEKAASKLRYRDHFQSL